MAYRPLHPLGNTNRLRSLRSLGPFYCKRRWKTLRAACLRQEDEQIPPAPIAFGWRYGGGIKDGFAGRGGFTAEALKIVNDPE